MKYGQELYLANPQHQRKLHRIAVKSRTSRLASSCHALNSSHSLPNQKHPFAAQYRTFVRQPEQP